MRRRSPASELSGLERAGNAVTRAFSISLCSHERLHSARHTLVVRHAKHVACVPVGDLVHAQPREGHRQDLAILGERERFMN